MAKYTRVSQIDPENHPLFNRLWTTEGFQRLTSESVEKFLDTPGLKIALFGDDPNNQKETLDILVIGAELKKSIEAALAPENGAWMSDVKEGRAWLPAGECANSPPWRSFAAASISVPVRD